MSSTDADLLAETARSYLAADSGRSLAELGAMDWLGLLVPESEGGTGWLPVEACALAEELGRATYRGAWSGTALAAAAVAQLPSAQRSAWLPDLLAGRLTGALALEADTVRVTQDVVDILVTVAPGRVRILAVEYGRSEPDAESLDTTRPVRLLSVTHAKEVACLADPADRLLSAARLLLAADAVGLLTGARRRLVDYLSERTAFDAPIGSFQAVQHRLVDLLVTEVKARAALLRAATALAVDAPEAGRSAAAAHAFTMGKVVAAVDECVQLSGGIGFTWEYPLHHELRRALLDATALGDARTSRAHYAQLVDW